MGKNGFSDFVKVIKQLRGPDGCPWDQVQTYESLEPYIIEEAYELLDAIENKNFSHIKEELGDILLHVVMLANMAEEQNLFDINNVIELEKNKMISRHPHVFSDTKVNSLNDIWHNWEKIKKTENQENKSLLASIPKNLPSLIEAEKLQKG